VAVINQPAGHMTAVAAPKTDAIASTCAVAIGVKGRRKRNAGLSGHGVVPAPDQPAPERPPDRFGAPCTSLTQKTSGPCVRTYHGASSAAADVIALACHDHQALPRPRSPRRSRRPRGRPARGS
jgi:hypothetical protein